LSLISSQLQNLSIFGMLHNGSVTVVYLLEISADFLEVVFGRDSLQSSDSFSSGSLLDSDVAESLFGTLLVFELL
ncbi:hypothetical protein PFISCL1PPCAC_28362, partial [Pristionchus fissidentatus]